MKSSPETIRFHLPLCGAELLRSLPAEAAREEQLQEARDASYHRGRIDGEKALSQQLLQQRAELNEVQNGVLNSLRQALPQVIRDCENALIALALETARKLVLDLPVSQELIERNLKEALGHAEESTILSIQLHPDDLQLLEKTNSPFLQLQPGDRRLRFESSAEISRGGCRVLTRFGIIDATRETKFALIEKALVS